MDKIIIRDLELLMSIGIYEHEKTNKQRVIVNIELVIQAPQAGWGKENIKETVSYEELIQGIKVCAAQKHFELVETFAQEVSDICLKAERALSVNVRIEKPDIIPQTHSVGIEITRKKEIKP